MKKAMKWIKKGLIFNVNKNFGWMNTHAQIPTVLVLEDRLRVYFSTRKSQNKSELAYIELDIQNPKKIIYLNDKPLLDNGKVDSFDEHGIMPSEVFRFDEKVYLYYSGWSRKGEYPYENLTGLAISEDGGRSFLKYNRNPILNLNNVERYSATSPCIVFNDDIFYMFYCSGVEWLKINGKYEHVYDIKYAISKDGLNFEQNQKVAIPQN